MQNKIIVITGPTATGKTGLSIELAKKFNGEVVSADSMQIYKKMDIGTAKVTKDEMDGIVHHMVDIIEPSETFSVSRYVEMASEICDDIIARNKMPILVGGTGLYIDSLIKGRTFAISEDDGGVAKAELEGRYDEIGGEALLTELSQLDPERAAKLHASDKRRIVRAIEVYLLTGKTLTWHDEETKKLPPKYDAITIALDYDNREDLYERINLRVDLMMYMGLMKEVEDLMADGINSDMTSMQAIGYKELVAYKNGACSLKDAIENIKRESRRYAKRQLTWLRAKEGICWIKRTEEMDFSEVLQVSTNFIENKM